MKINVGFLVAGQWENFHFKNTPDLAKSMAALSSDSPYGQKVIQYEKNIAESLKPQTPTGTGSGVFFAYEKPKKKAASPENILGFLTMTFVKDESLEIDFFCVGEKFRRQNIGALLWEACEYWAQENQIPRIVLDVGQNNLAALSFYQKQGFQKVGSRKAYYASKEDALVYEKFLDKTTGLPQKIKKIPHTPGVYIYTNEEHVILYVGKAKNLYKRVKSYFVPPERLTPKTRALVAKIFDVQVLVTPSEYESLILENNLIKEHNPPYNILLRDDKTYPYIRIDLNEDWPKPYLTRRRKPDGSLYFGPYVDGSQWQQLLKFIHRFFPLVKCNKHMFNTVSRPCSYYEIKQCLGPCKLPVDPLEYRTHVNRVIDLLSGRVSAVVKKLKQDITQAAVDQEFERAILLRDQLFAIEKQDVLQSIQLDIPIHCDMISWAKTSSGLTSQSPQWWVIHVVHVREGRVVGATPLSINLSRGGLKVGVEISTEKELLLSLLCQFYETHTPPPWVALVEEELASIPLGLYLPTTTTVCAADDLYKNIKTTEKNLLKKISQQTLQQQLQGLIELAQKNAAQTLNQKISDTEKVLQELEDVRIFLGLKDLPERVECYDISTLQGSHTVGARVVFAQGVASTADYRLYTIRNPEAQTNDFASLREVLQRRFKSGDPLPDALVLDGGEPQVREAAKLFLEIGLGHLSFFGLAKARTERGFQRGNVRHSEERIVFPPRNAEGGLEISGIYTTKTLTAGSPAYRWFTRLRDETHRRAIGFHRIRRGKEVLR